MVNMTQSQLFREPQKVSHLKLARFVDNIKKILFSVFYCE